MAMGTESEEAEEKDDSNKLGDVIKHLVDNDTGTSAFTMSTATDFRGDGKKQMWDSLRKETKIFQRDFAQHFKTLGVKTFRLEIQEFKSNPIKQFVRHLKKEKTEYHYVAVPPCNVSWRKDFTEDTDWGVDVLINEIKKAWKGVRILNLVPDEERSGELGTKKALLKEPKKPSAGEPQYDIVLTCMLGREGTDWCPASRIHVLYAERSITLSVQTLGRVSRRFRRTDKDDPKSVVYLKSRYARSGEGKQTIIARYYYPFFPEPKKGMTKDELLDGRKNGLLLMLQAEEQFLPILYPEIPSVTTKGKKGTGDKPLSLAELLGEKYQDLKEDFVTAIVEFGAQGMTCTDFDAIVDELLTEYEVPEQYLQVSKEALQVLYLRHSNIAFRGIDISFVREHGFPQLYKRVKDKSLVFGHSVKNMKLLKKIVQESFDAMLEMIEHKIEMVMHLPKSERYDAAGFTRQERAWISLRREEYGL